MTTKTSTMTNEERLKKTIHLQKADKVLFGPSINTFVAKYVGMTTKEFYANPEKVEAAYEKCFNDMGGWDLVRNATPAPAFGGLFNRMAMPGSELEENVVHQAIETEVMLPEDYDFAIENGLKALQDRLDKRANHKAETVQVSPEERKRRTDEAAKRAKAVNEKWRARGTTCLTAGMPTNPLGYFTSQRSLLKFPMDLRRIPEKVKQATKVCMPEYIAQAKKMIENTGIPRVTMGGGLRGGATIFSAKAFEEFAFPNWLEAVYAITDAGYDVVFHCDSDWTKFIHYFKEFPKGRCVLQLDGATDIFKAKEILKDHMVLMGDVPAPMLTLDTPENVFEYCKKLINIIGEDGAFILNSGCETPYNSKIENVAAMCKAGNELTWRN